MKKTITFLWIMLFAFTAYSAPNTSISIPNSFSPNTTISSSATNSNNNEISNKFNTHSHTGDIAGTDITTTGQGAIPYFSGTGVVSMLAAGTANQFLITNGSGANPSWSNNITHSANTTFLTVNKTGTGAGSLLDLTNEGTGAVLNITQNGVLSSYALSFVSNAVQTTSSMMYIVLSNAANTVASAVYQNVGTDTKAASILTLTRGIQIGANVFANEIDSQSHGAASTQMYIGQDTITHAPPSDISTKNIKGDTKYNLSDLMKLKVKDFTYKPDKVSDGEKEHTGLIAQDVELLFPDAIIHRTDGLLAIDYLKLVPILIKANQDLSNRVDDLEKRIEKLEKK